MKQCLLAIAFVLLGLTTCVEAAPPNFVVFISDDHGSLDSQPYGATDIRTPNMARLAAEGMRFTHAFCASPACGPSRTAMLTGLWPARNGAERNHVPKRSDVVGLTTAMRALKYEVVAIGKVAHNDWASLYDFDHASGRIGLTDTAEVKSYLESRDATKPLCLFVGTRHPHTIWSPNDGYDPAQLVLPPNHVDTPETREYRARYSTDVTNADRLLGEVRQLAKEHLGDDTIFVYTADHGGQWPFGKWNLYDAGIRVPFIMAWPGKIKPGSISAAMVCLPDLLPTFIELAGGKVPDGIDGKSFASVVRGTATEHREHVFNTHSGDGDYNVYPIRSLRTKDWKYIRNLHPEFQHHTHDSRFEGPLAGRVYWTSWVRAAEDDPAAAAIVKKFSERPAEELYDLRRDPHELRNLAYDPQYADLLASMREEVTQWMKEQGDQQTVFGTPLRLGEPVTILNPPTGKKKSK